MILRTQSTAMSMGLKNNEQRNMFKNKTRFNIAISVKTEYRIMHARADTKKVETMSEHFLVSLRTRFTI